MAKDFDYAGAKAEGYSDDEIMQHLSQKHEKFDVQGALKEGYTPEEINQHLAKYKDTNEKAQPSRAKSLISAPIKGLLQGGQGLNPLQMFQGPISPEMGKNILNRALPTQNKPAEKILERAGQLAPAVAMGPEGLLLKGAQLAGGAAAGYLAEEGGLGKGGQIVSEIMGMSFPGLMKSLGLKAFGLLQKGLSKSTGSGVAKLTNLKPEEIKTAVQEAAERLGVKEELPISSQVDNPKIQAIETKLMQSAAGGPIQKKIEKLGGKLEETYKDVGDQLSKRQNLLPSAVAGEAATTAKAIEEAGENAYRSLYNQANKALPANAVSPAKIGVAINRIIDWTAKKLRSDLGTPSKDAVYNRLNRLKESWAKDHFIQSGSIPIEKLIELKQDLNQVIKYETKGGVDKLLLPLQQVTKQAIQQYGKQSNPQFLNRFNQAEKTFANNAKNFRKNPVMKSLASGQNPEQVFSKMNTVKGIRDLEKVFNKTPEGKEAMDALKKYKLEDLLNRRVLDKNGNISWGKSAGMLKDAKIRDLVLELVGPEQYRKLKDLSKISSGVEEGFKKFLNTSKTQVAATDLALYVALPIKASSQLFSKNYLGALRSLAMIFGPAQLAKIMANPKFAEAAIATAKAGKGNNSQKFLDSAQKVAQITAHEILKDINPESQNQSMANQ